MIFWLILAGLMIFILGVQILYPNSSLASALRRDYAKPNIIGFRETDKLPHYAEYDECYMMADVIVKNKLVVLPKWLPEGEDYTFWLANEMLADKNVYDRALKQYNDFEREQQHKIESKKQWDEFNAIEQKAWAITNATVRKIKNSDPNKNLKIQRAREETTNFLDDEFQRIFAPPDTDVVTVTSWDGKVQRVYTRG